MARKLRVLVACEFSGTVRDAFRRRGHDAWSCDLLPCEADPQWHIQGDAIDAAYMGGPWDLMIAHPPCTHLAVSGAAWFHRKQKEQREALDFVEKLWGAGISRIAVENPVSILSTRSILGKPTQIVQPWMFGHTEQKKTCLWLKGLQKLIPTNDVKLQMLELPKNQRERLHYLPPSPDRWKLRSMTYPGIASAMADQWGGYGA